MSQKNKIALASELLANATASLKSAKLILDELSGGASPARAEAVSAPASLNAPVLTDESEKIVEGVFDGQNMLGSDQKTYPVPANYASKSKLIPGDVLKLTILTDGRFMYKQIGPIERKTVIGVVTYDEGKYKIIADGRVYHVLTASITYYKASPGDEVSLIVPAGADSEWGAIDNVIINQHPTVESAGEEDKEKTSKKTTPKKKQKGEDDTEYEIVEG